MQEDALQRDLPAPDEAYARHHYLHQGVEAPDLATIKDFFRFFIAMSCGKIVAKPTVDSINTNAEWFFTGFTRITGTEINVPPFTLCMPPTTSMLHAGAYHALPFVP